MVCSDEATVDVGKRESLSAMLAVATSIAAVLLIVVSGMHA